MIKNDWVGRSFVQIPVPAKFFTSKISATLLPSLYNMKLMHVRGVFFDCFPCTCERIILSLINKRCTWAALRLKKIHSKAAILSLSVVVGSNPVRRMRTDGFLTCIVSSFLVDCEQHCE